MKHLYLKILCNQIKYFDSNRPGMSLAMAYQLIKFVMNFKILNCSLSPGKKIKFFIKGDHHENIKCNRHIS